MFSHRIIAALFAVFAVALALEPPTYAGYSRVWFDNFAGTAGSLPSLSKWNVISNSVLYNNEQQVYTSNKKNVQLSGTGRFQLIPRYDVTAPNKWTSGRVESKYTFTPTAGKITRVESQLRVAGNAAVHKQAIWPAFWMMGDAYRKGAIWPGSGEIDIMENINGEKVGYGTIHCDVYPGGACNEPSGISAPTALPNFSWHVWRVEINRKSSDFKAQSITWFMDGKQFNKATGAQIGSSTAWTALCHKPLYFILNVAVGGDWPGLPNAKTWGGPGSMMEISYVAHYVST